MKKNMSQARIEAWSRKMAKPRLSKAPELKTLPPTTEAFEQNERKKFVAIRTTKHMVVMIVMTMMVVMMIMIL